MIYVTSSNDSGKIKTYTHTHTSIQSKKMCTSDQANGEMLAIGESK